MKIKINIHKISMLFLYLYFLILPIDSALGNIIGYISIINYVALLYTLFRIIEIGFRKKINVSKLSLNKFLIFYPLYFFATVLFRQIEEYNTFFVSSFFISYIVCILSIINEYSENEIRLLKKIILLSIISILIIFMTLGDFTSFNGRLSLNSSKAMDPNFFSIGLCMITSVSFYNIINKNKLLINILALIFIFIIITMTGSRSGILANGFVVICLFLFSNVKKKTKLIVTIFMPIILVIFMSLVVKFVPKNILSRFSFEYTEKDSGAGRFDIWEAGIKTFIGNTVFREIIGTGGGTYQYITRYDGHAAHNIYIQTLVECGIIGEFLLLGMLIVTLKNNYAKKNYIIFAALAGLMLGANGVDLIISRTFWMCLFLGNANIKLINK